MSSDTHVLSFYLISISLAVAVGIGSRGACLLLHDFYDYKSDLKETVGDVRGQNISYQNDNSYKPKCIKNMIWKTPD